MTRFCMAGGLIASFIIALAPATAQDEIPTDFDRWMIVSVNPVGNGDFIGAPKTGSDFVKYDELLFQKCSELGSRSARVLASWREVEAEKGKWDWSSLDEELRLCEKYRIEPVVLITNIPAWVSPTGKPAHDRPPKEENADDFTNFITKLAERCKERVRYYEFWNEQNGCMWINEGCKNAEMAHTYLPWLRRCYKAIKAVDARAQVAIGGLDDADGHAPLWVEQAYKIRKDQYDNEKLWDGIADHPYDKKAEDAVDVTVGKLDAIRAIAARYGDKNIPLWITEYGWNACDMGLDVQKISTGRFLKRFMQPDQKDLVIAQQLAIADFEQAHLGYGLCDLNLRPRPAFAEFQLLARGNVATPLILRYLIDINGALRVSGKMMPGADSDKNLTYVEVTDEQGKQLASESVTNPFNLETSFPDLPKDTPLLVTISSDFGGQRQPPVVRLPIILPAGALANGGFEAPFRAGIPWGWMTSGQAIARDGGSADEQYRRTGKQALMLMLFDHADPPAFDDQIEIPVHARKGDRFTARCFARYGGNEDTEAIIILSADLKNPAYRIELPRSAGEVIGRDWTPIKAELVAPCDAPNLVLHATSETLPKKPWFLCIDDVSLTPANKETR